MAATASTKTLPVLVQLNMEYTDGGSSPWFNSKGRSVVSRLTTEPRNADLFLALAHDGTMGSLISFLDREQPSVGHVALFCYVLTGLVLLELFVLLPCASFGLRFYTATVGPVAWIACEVILLVCAGAQLICLLSMISTWFGMGDGLGAKAPEAYQWTFELLRNYTNVTIAQLKNAAKPDKHKMLDAVQDATITGIKWLQGNLSLWDNTFDAYESLQSMVTGPISIVQMIVLGMALAAAVSAGLLACGAWNRRKLALEAGGNSPLFVATIVIASAVLLLTHLAMALPIVARWLPLCTLGETYLCAPYRSGAFAVLDNSVAKVWPLADRPEPFCRLVPSKLSSSCATKGKTGINDLSACPVKPGKKALDVSQDAEEELRAILLRRDHAPLAGLQVNAKKVISGDCFYPHKVIDTDIASVCPLFTDDLVAHWMALVFSVVFGMVAAIAAGAIAAIYMAVGSKIAKTTRVVRKRRRIKRRQKKSKKGKKIKERHKKKASPTPPPAAKPPATPPTSPSPLSEVASMVDISVQVPIPVPTKKSSKHRRRHSEPPVIVLAPPPWYPPPSPYLPSPPPPPAFMPLPRLLTTPEVTPLPLAVPVASAARLATPAVVAPTIPAMTSARMVSPRCTCLSVPGNDGSRVTAFYVARK